MAYNDRNALGLGGSEFGDAIGTGVAFSLSNAKAMGAELGSTGASRRVLSASSIAGDRVCNTAGDDLGTIEEVMIDLESGRVAYAVLSFGGFLGIGDKLFAIPWDSMELNTSEHEFILNVDKQTLENAPGFDKDNWPNMADPTWGSQVHAHYGRTPYWEANAEYARPSDINSGQDVIGGSVEGARTRSAGSTSTSRGDY